jgi:CheY-like chemotaxis protein
MNGPDLLSSPAACRVLVIEDHPDAGSMMRTMLQMLGLHAEVTGSMVEALELAERESFDLYLVDYRLPDGNGADVLRALSTRGEVKAVLLTAYDQSALGPSITAGFSACLRKPVDKEDLRRTIEKLRS